MSVVQNKIHQGYPVTSRGDASEANAPLHESLMPELDHQLRLGMKPSWVDDAGRDSHQLHQRAHEDHLAHQGHVAHENHLAHVAHLNHAAHAAHQAPASQAETSNPVKAQPPSIQATLVQAATVTPSASTASTVVETQASTELSPEPGRSTARSVREAASQVSPKFMPVLRGDESAKDAKIQTQADFGRAADEVARNYGLDPNLFRAQLQVESGAFTNDFRQAMRHEGDLGRASENNTSIGLGQISRKFLDGREWSGGGPGNPRVGSQVVTTEQYVNSPTVQLRMAASNLTQRLADNGGLERGLSYYVSGNANPNANGQSYIAKIDSWMTNPAVIGV